MTISVRPAAVAGRFYPGSPRQLDDLVRTLLDQAGSVPTNPTPKAIIAPHAGFVYSGEVAATAYARWQPVAGQVRRVILLGPCHRVPVDGLALSSADSFETPLGRVPVDADGRDCASELEHVCTSDVAHAEEHSLEVHLPFLQHLFPQAAIVPLVVGRAKADAVAEVLDRLWGGDETRIVLSSDLSHYLDYEAARRVDEATCKAIEALDPVRISIQHACGRYPLAGLLTLAKQRQMVVKTLDLRNSGDTAGDKRRVVGYGAWMVVEPHQSAATLVSSTDAAGESPFVAQTRALLDKFGTTLIQLAAASIKQRVRGGPPIAYDPSKYPDELRRLGASFVTLRRHGHLRGCIGSPEAHRPLAVDVIVNAAAAAVKDRRFPPLTWAERDGLNVSVSVLSPREKIRFRSRNDLIAQLRVGVDGIAIESAGVRSLFLPQVWDQVPKPTDFLSLLMRKAGLPEAHWSEDTRAWRFVALSVKSEALQHPNALWT